MGFWVTIGNAELTIDTDDITGTQELVIFVKTEESNFINNCPVNTYYTSFAGWSYTCRDLGIYDLMYEGVEYQGKILPAILEEEEVYESRYVVIIPEYLSYLKERRKECLSNKLVNDDIWVLDWLIFWIENALGSWFPTIWIQC